jgi:hypothetical protein
MTSVPGRARSANSADPADTSGFDRLAAQDIALSALIAFAGYWRKRAVANVGEAIPSGPIANNFFANSGAS